jgi:hypothetical protein
MVENSREAEPAERAFWSWLGFWAQFVLLAICVVIGAFSASNAEGPGNYIAGLLLILGAVALGFLRLKQRFDGGATGLRAALFVDRMTSLAVVIPLFAVIGLAGLFIADAWPYGSLHNAGIALFIASGVIVFLDIKQVFDRLNSP